MTSMTTTTATTPTTPAVVIIPELLNEVLATLAGHHNSTVDELRANYAANVGSLKLEVLKLYVNTLYLLRETAASN